MFALGKDIEQQTGINYPVSKITIALASLGITSWSDLAAALAALYSALLITEWLWKKVLRPFCERRNWLKPRKRRLSDKG